MSELPALPDRPWPKLSQKASEAIGLSRAVHRSKHGLFAGIPIMCRGDKCPYSATCIALMYDKAPVGEPCPVEIGMILNLFEKYTTELKIDTSQVVNLGLVKDLIEAEITIARCDAILARDGDLVQEVVVGVTPQGRVIRRPEPHVALAIRDKAKAAKNVTLQLLNSTPKDKAKREGAVIIDPSTYAAKIFRQYMKERTLDGEFREVAETDDEGNRDDNRYLSDMQQQA